MFFILHAVLFIIYRFYKALIAKLLRQGYRYHKLRNTFYRRHSGLVQKYNVNFRKILQQGVSEPEFYGGLVYRIRKIVGKSNCVEQFRKLINRYKRIGYNSYIMRHIACLVVTQSRLTAMPHSLIARRWFGPQTQWRPLRKAFTRPWCFVFGLARRGSTSGFL